MILPLRPPVIVHHMAAVSLQAALDGQYPPNSLEAIRACLEAKAAFIEVDVSALADADYLLVHDDMLESETTGMGLVIKCSAQRARELCIRRRDGTPTALHVPLLSEVVALFQQYPGDTRLQLDFKNLYPF